MPKYNKDFILDTRKMFSVDSDTKEKIEKYLFEGSAVFNDVDFYGSRYIGTQSHYVLHLNRFIEFGKKIIEASLKREEAVFRFPITTRYSSVSNSSSQVMHAVVLHFDFKNSMARYKDSFGDKIPQEIYDLVEGIWPGMKIESDIEIQQSVGLDNSCDLISLYNAKSLLDKIGFISTVEARKDAWDNVVQYAEENGGVDQFFVPDEVEDLGELHIEPESKSNTPNEKKAIFRYIADQLKTFKKKKEIEVEIEVNFDDESQISLGQYEEGTISTDFSKQKDYPKMIKQIIKKCLAYKARKELEKLSSDILNQGNGISNDSI